MPRLGGRLERIRTDQRRMLRSSSCCSSIASVVSVSRIVQIRAMHQDGHVRLVLAVVMLVVRVVVVVLSDEFVVLVLVSVVSFRGRRLRRSWWERPVGCELTLTLSGTIV
jgi:hypothetical protein